MSLTGARRGTFVVWCVRTNRYLKMSHSDKCHNKLGKACWFQIVFTFRACDIAPSMALFTFHIFRRCVSSTPSTGELAPTKRIQAPQQNKALPPDPVAPAPAPAPVNMRVGGFGMWLTGRLKSRLWGGNSCWGPKSYHWWLDDWNAAPVDRKNCSHEYQQYMAMGPSSDVPNTRQ